MNKDNQEKKQYFTKNHEQAILDYLKTDNKKTKNDLYVEFIQPAFDEMVEKIVYTYKFNFLPNIDSLKSDCKMWLITVLDKYDPDKGFKAFSYFSILTKNWFIEKTKSNNNKKKVYLEDVLKTQEESMFSYEDSYVDDTIKVEFWDSFFQELESWKDKKMKTNEKKIYDAIVILFNDKDKIEIFNKKAIYLYIREMTGLNTKQIANGLKKFKVKYDDFKYNWEND